MRRLLSIVVASVVLVSCTKVPSDVIQPRDMAELMADMHTGEAVIDMNRNTYVTDSAKQALKQAVYSRHGVDAATVDSSLAWYGRHIDIYMDVCERTIAILEERLVEIGNSVAATRMSVAGDSVDVWGASPFLTFTGGSPSYTVAFDIVADENWAPGDNYTWRGKFFNSNEGNTWQIVAEYTDGTLEFISQTISGDGWKELIFHTDSLRQAARLYGYAELPPRPGSTLAVDSIALVRKRLDHDNYSHRYMQRRFVHLMQTDTVNSAVK